MDILRMPLGALCASGTHFARVKTECTPMPCPLELTCCEKVLITSGDIIFPYPWIFAHRHVGL